MGQRYLRRDLSKRLQRWLCHLERLQLSRGHYLGGWSQVWRQMRGHWLDSAHGLWSQDLRQGRWLSHWKRLEEERELCAQTQKKSSDLLTCMLIGSHSLPHTCTPTYTLRFTHKATSFAYTYLYNFKTACFHSQHSYTVNHIHTPLTYTNTHRPPNSCWPEASL